MQDHTEKPFEVKKKFGIGVLLKLTKKYVNDIEVSSIGDRFVSNVTFPEMQKAVNKTLRDHNICLKVP